MIPPEKQQISSNTPSRASLMQLLYGHRASQAIFVMSNLGLADLLKTGAQHYTELAKATGSHASSLYRLLRYLVSLGVLVEAENGHFSLTAVGEEMETGVRGSESAFARFFAEPWFQEPWTVLLHTVKTGETAFNHVHGMGLFQYLKQHLKASEIFNAAMSEGSKEFSAALTAAYDFSKFKTLVDVGGGQGELLLAILKTNQSLHGILFDRSEVAEGAKKRIELAGFSERCKVVAGDFFDEVPKGFDAYVLRQIVHDWDDTRNLQILANIRRAIAPGGKLLIVESLLPPRTEASLSSQLAVGRDINMMVTTGGQERTESEFRALLDSAGFKLTDIIRTERPDCLIEAIPI